ncbi:MAG: LD-carboxypeptidase [Bacteroidales bacterium]|nr:LD-carboxypeptidase [Bacteroidales bacterium]
MIIPHYLKTGDAIGIIAPGRRMDENELLPAFELMRNEGFHLLYDERLFEKGNYWFAGSDDFRAAYIQSMLDDPNIQAIWCIRGGYGSMRIIDRLDFSKMCEHPKWICGFSDITVFHAHLHTCCEMATLHSVMPVNITDSSLRNTSIETMLAALRGEELRYEFPTHPLNRPGNVTAPIVGGNLSIIYSITGSRSDLDTDGKILFIEDLDEYLYHIDRMMYNLKRSGRLEGLAGLIVGHLSDMHDNPNPFGHTAEEIIAECCAEYDFPVIFNFPAGHLADNRAIRMGCPMEICCTQNSVMTIQKGSLNT